MPEETTHKRRVRYKGTHPRTFEEKYKEHDPEKYADTVARVIEKGSTPAGMHIPIMVKEILDFLQIRPGQKGLDATLGYGGHTRKMLEKLTEASGTSELTDQVYIKDDVQTKNDSWENPEENPEDNSRDNPADNSENNSEEVFRRKAPEGHLYALDVDPIEIVKTGERLQKAGYGEEILTILQQNFANLETVAKEYGPFDFMLADLGVSSMQIDDPKRGFSYKADGPLDLRLDPQHGIPASQRLRELNREELIGMLVENSDEPYAEQIASEICKTFKKGGSMDTTTALREAIERALCFLPENKEKKDILKKTCQRVFQALRIDVNSEFEVLEAFLNALPEALADGGRVAILTFHSGEDRLVKKAFQQYYREGIFEEIATDVIRPTAEECRQNGRARSTKMRWAVRAGR
ncbi:MAG: 16S rRNA (cytosine(1402)-N(4))-methyltransferase RsmH [Lachnospiraceae bacterium]|nr:16S rRNA (cytosine(1402)-N(4))-methyltransferase RsmH [Lachnospiraceae bacterium]